MEKEIQETQADDGKLRHTSKEMVPVSGAVSVAEELDSQRLPWDPWGRGWAGLWAWMHRNHEEEPGNEEEEEMNDEDALASAYIMRFNREMKEIKRSTSHDGYKM